MQEQSHRYRLRFDGDTAKRLRRLAVDALKKANSNIFEDSLGVDHWVDVFIGSLELYADTIPSKLTLYPPKQQKRREAIRSMGAALQRVSDIYMELDSGAKRYIISEAIGKLAKAYGEENPYPNTLQTGEMIYREEVPVIFDLQIIAKAIHDAADTMPNPDIQPIELIIARSIERLFFDYGIPFTTSETSFAAECLRAVLGLAGIEKERMDYWLRKTKNHPESMFEFFKKLRQTNEKIS